MATPSPVTTSLRTKFSYGLGDIGASLSYVIINTFLLNFLIEEVGLIPWLAGLVIVVGRLVDAVSDPLMGWWLDRYKNHVRWMLLGAVPFGISFTFVWSLNLWSISNPWLQALVAMLLTSVHIVIFTMVQVPYTALTPLLAPDYHARTQLTAYRVAAGTFASLLGVALAPLLVAMLDAWLLMALCFAVVMSACYLLCIAGIRAAVVALPQAPSSQESLTTLWQQWRTALQTFGFVSVLSIFALVTIGMSIVTSMLPFFTDMLQLDAGQQSLVLGLLFVMGIITLPLWTFISKRYGKAKGLALGLAVLLVVLPLLVMTSSTGLSLSLIAWVLLAGCCVGALLLFPWSMLPDVLEFAELESNTRNEGSFYALFTFVQKLAAALGIALNAVVLSMVGYQQRSTTESMVHDSMVHEPIVQSALAYAGIRWMLAGGASLLFVLALVAVWRYPINAHNHQQAQKDLAKRYQ